MLILIPIFLPMLVGILMLMLKKISKRGILLLLTAGSLTIAFVLTIVISFSGESSFTLFHMTKQLVVYFHVDELTRLFAVFAPVVMLVVSFYAFSYMKHEHEEKRFFAFYLLASGAVIGLIFAGNLFTMYLFFEMLTLFSFVLVLHRRTVDAIQAGMKYIFYSIAGAFLSLFGIMLLYHICGDVTFRKGGVLSAEAFQGNETLLLVSVFLILIGFGAKAGMVPMQGWLPTAHPEAPTPASAVLSGVITKAGVFVILRIIFYCVGSKYIMGTWVQYTWAGLALLTIFIGSMMAYRERQIKKRLAYSTVSQVSYILFGLSTLHPIGVLGALLHVVFHSIIKNTLFLTAGAMILKTGRSDVTAYRGIGKRMPITLWCFTLSSLALIGIPPASGFLSKWYLAEGALRSGMGIYTWLGPVVLLVSALLTAGYLLPITLNGFFPGTDFDYSVINKCEPDLFFIIPIVILTAASVLLGIWPEALITLISIP